MSAMALQQQQHQQTQHMQQQHQAPLSSTIKDNSGRPLAVYFQLEVAQQPDRARMCGFGDKVAAAYYECIKA